MSRYRFPSRPDEDNNTVVERIPRHVLARTLKKSKSLHPNHKLIEAAARGDAEALAFRDAWRFSFPVTVLTQEHYASLLSRTEGVLFNE